MRTLAVVLALTASWLAASASSGAGQVLSDDFDGNVRAPLWTQLLLGTGSSLVQANGRLEITLAPGSTGAVVPNLPNTVFGGYEQSACQITGDFDLQVDYSLLVWPPRNGAWLFLAVYIALRSV